MGRIIGYINKNKIDAAVCLLAGIFSVIFFCIIVHIWNFDLNIPFSYDGDAIGMLQRLNLYVRGERLSSVQSLGAPFGSNQWHQLSDAIFPNIIMYFLAKITKNVGYTINGYYILTFALSAMCTFIAMRMLKTSRTTAAACGIIYAFIPGHMYRSEFHMFVGSCFILPFLAVSVIYLVRGELCKAEYQNKEKLALKEVIQSVDKKFIFCLVSLVLTTLSTLYYGIFGMYILTFAAVYILINKKQWRHIFYYFLLCLAELACIAAIYLPMIITQITDDNYTRLNIITREMGDVEVFGLKLVQLILPIPDHRLSLLSKYTQLYNAEFPLINENSMSALGLIMAVGFVCSFFIVLFKLSVCEELKLCARMNIFMYSIAAVGGGASIVAFINYGIRCYNRFSYYIGFFSLIIVGRLFEDFWKYLGKQKYRKPIMRTAKLIVAAVAVCAAIFDQTSGQMAYSAERGVLAAEKFYNDKEFVKNIEEYEGDNASVLVLPFAYGSQGVNGYTKDNVFTVYREKLLTMHSVTSKWSVGALAGERADLFLENLSNREKAEVLKLASVAGYSGIALYHPGYTDDNLLEWQRVLKENLGESNIKRGGEAVTWEYYSMSDFTKKLKQQFSIDEWANLEEICHSNFLPRSVSGKDLRNTNPASYDKCAMIVQPEDVQYGPYYTLREGNYKITILGENLDKAEYQCTSERGQVEVEKLNVQITDSLVTYEIHLHKLMEEVEFICRNKSESTVKVEQIQCNQTSNDSEITKGYEKLLNIALGE